MIIYHKIDNYYGVIVNGMTVFSGSYDACVAYLELFSCTTSSSALTPPPSQPQPVSSAGTSIRR